MDEILRVAWVVASVILGGLVGIVVGKRLRDRVPSGWLILLILTIAVVLFVLVIGVAALPREYVDWLFVLLGGILYGATSGRR